MIDNKVVMPQELQTVGYYGLNNNGYEVIDLKESHVLRMFDADEITAQPVCLLSDAIDIIDALRAVIAQPEQATVQPEPVAWRRVNPHTGFDYVEHQNALNGMQNPCWQPLYATPTSMIELSQAIAQPEHTAPPESALHSLARRCLWIAYCWNEHNFSEAYTYARKTAQELGINDFDEANRWLVAQPEQTKENK